MEGHVDAKRFSLGLHSQANTRWNHPSSSGPLGPSSARLRPAATYSYIDSARDGSLTLGTGLHRGSNHFCSISAIRRSEIGLVM